MFVCEYIKLINLMSINEKHIVIDARIRTLSTGRPVTFLLENLQILDKKNRYTILLNKNDSWKPVNKNFSIKYISFRNFSFNFFNQFFYSIFLYRLKADLVHFTFTGIQPLLYFRKQTTFTHDLTMLNINYIGSDNYPNWLLKIGVLGFRFLLWSAHYKSKEIIVPTNYVANDVKKYHKFTSKKITVTYESGESHLNFLEKKKLDIKMPFILSVGVHAPHKNIKRLILAFEILKNKHKNLKLILVGKIGVHIERYISSIKDKEVYNHLIFTGYVEDENLKWLYSNAEAYVFTSLTEGFGLTTLEAMNLGCPVVCSDAACLPEVNGNGALYFNPLNIHDIANKVELVLSNDQLKEDLIKKGLENSKRFSWKKMTKETLSVFNRYI